MVIVLRGISGAGKSSFIKTLKDPLVFSADHFFIDELGNYIFDKEKLGQAHATCLRNFVNAIKDPYNREKTLVVDNTNLLISDMAPYCGLAHAFWHELKIINLICDPEEAIQRNVHKVPPAVIKGMFKIMEKETSRIPSRWPQATMYTSRVLDCDGSI